MRILYVGDVMAEPGLRLLENKLPKIRAQRNIDVVVAQAENLSDGKGITLHDFQRLRAAGVDACTGGNWTMHREDIFPVLSDPNQPIVRPANYPEGTPGLGCKYITVGNKVVMIVSILGQIVGRDADKPVDNPLRKIDDILASAKPHDVSIVNLHGDYSSEKVVFGHYVDGRVTMMVGDHWHVPTADARVLPGGTAHMTDVGMCGVLNASLGVEYESIIPRWRDGKQTRNVLAEAPPYQFSGLLVETDETNSVASVEHIYQISD